MNNRRPSRSRRSHEYEFQRTYKACTPCARRKVKCEPGDDHKCLRCTKKRIDCVFTSKKPWSRSPKDVPSRERRLTDDGEAIQRSPSETYQQSGTKQGGLPTSILQKVVSNNNDAMNILYEAVALEEGHDIQNNDQSARPGLCIPRTLNDTDALRIWNACRFVKMGWFTAHEAMQLVDLFFINMSPLSPILTDFFATKTNQFYLVTQEPMLCCTILMISSRHHTLPGVGGCTRAFFIHQRLWQHCQHILMRLTLGQEKISKAKTRNIGSIEALLLMSEWFPRILQFPPETDGWDSDFIMTNLDGRDPPLPMEEIPVSDSWKQHVVEPTKRFERMSWMVLSCALALAHELGVFDSNSHIPLPNDLVGADAENYLEHLELRRQRLPNLLFVFINALSSRIGCTSLMPSDTVLPLPDISLLRRDRKSREWLAFMKSWTELTKLTTSIMNTLFPLMNTALASGSAGTFLSILDQKQTLLADWRQRNLAVADTELGYANILFIEHQHLRVLINSIGMQLVLRRVLSQISLYGGSTIDHFFVEKARELNMTSREYGFIEDVIQGCCQILERITSLGDSGTLYFSPMRILFRTISASIFLMKALALGVRQSKLQEALRILDQAIAALQEKSQDDVHLKLQYATLLQSQAARLRGSLVSSQPTTGPSQPVSEMANRHVPPIEISTDMNQPSEADVQTFFELPTHESMDFDVNEWLYLPFDPSMAPFGEAEGEFGARLDGVDLDLNFLWQLPP